MEYSITGLDIRVYHFYDPKNELISKAMEELGIKDNDYNSYKLTFEINGEYATTYTNAIRRMFLDENDNISALDMENPQDNIICNDRHFLLHKTYLDIENIPIAYDTEVNNTYSINVENKQDSDLIIMSKHLNLPAPQSHVICTLSAGYGIIVKNLKVKKGRGMDRAKFSACCNISCEPLDVTFSDDIYKPDSKYLRLSGKISDEDLHKKVRISALLKCAKSPQNAKDFIHITFTNLVLRFQYILNYFVSTTVSSFTKISFTEIKTESNEYISTLHMQGETETVTELIFIHIANEYDTCKKFVASKDKIEFLCIEPTADIYINVCKKIIENLMNLRKFIK
jgi:hypothetical protein